MWIAYNPHHLVDTATLTFQNYWNCSNWSETRTVIITSIPSAMIAPPPVFAGICLPIQEAAFVTLDSCSTLIIDSVHIPPAISSRFTLTKPLPDTMQLGTNDSLFFTFNPVDTVGTISANVQIFAHFYPAPGLDSTLNYFKYNAYLGDSDYAYFTQSIPVNLNALPSTGWSIYLSAPDSAAPGADVTYKIIQSGTLPSDVAAVNFTLTYNDDLLTFVRAEEPSVDTMGYVRTPDGLAHITFHIAPIGNDSVIATLHFFPSIARDTQTAIVINDPNLLTSVGAPESCIDSIAAGQTLFTLRSICGSNELSSFLQSGTVLIDNINPNPASGMITVGVSSIVGDASGVASSISATLSIIDALGRTVCQQNVVLAGSGENLFQLHIENLPSGIYAAELRGVGIISTRSFIKQ